MIFIRCLERALGVALLAAGSVMADAHAGKGLTLELVADRSTVAPGQPIFLGVRLKPDQGFHTYWRQPGIVGLAPTVEWSVPEGFEVGPLLWPEPERGKMAIYGVWCLKREVCLVAPVTVPASLPPETGESVTFKARLVWMACSETCHPGSAELALTLPVRREAQVHPTPAASLMAQTQREQPIEDKAWRFQARYLGPDQGFSLTISPPPSREVPKDAYFYGHQRLVDSNVDPVRHELPDGSVRLDLAMVESPDAIPDHLVGELWSATGWDGSKHSRLLVVRAPLEARDPPDAATGDK